MEFCAFGDTHARHEEIDLPECERAVFVGDALNLFVAQSEADLWAQLETFSRWLNARAKTSIFVPGNHDTVFEINEARARRVLGPQVQVLIDEEIEIEGMKIYGSPWQKVFMANHAFTLKEDLALKEKWAKIPLDIDLLITHTPPWGVGDFNGTNHAGDLELARALKERLHPALNIFGHIHGAWEAGWLGETSTLNVSSFDAQWVKREPLRVAFSARQVNSLEII